MIKKIVHLKIRPSILLYVDSSKQKPVLIRELRGRFRGSGDSYSAEHDVSLNERSVIYKGEIFRNSFRNFRVRIDSYLLLNICNFMSFVFFFEDIFESLIWELEENAGKRFSRRERQEIE